MPTLAIGDATMLNLLEPFVGVKAKTLTYRLPAESGPIAKINLSQIGHNGLRLGQLSQSWPQRLLHSLHGAGVNCINRFMFQIRCETVSHPFPAWREIHVNATAKNPVVFYLHLGMTN